MAYLSRRILTAWYNEYGAWEINPCASWHIDMTHTEALTKARTVKAQKKVVEELLDYDHAFLTKEGAEHFTKPFGFAARTYIERANPNNPKGLTLPGGTYEAEGIAAHKLALQIASHLGVEVPDMFGIGSQLRVACARIHEAIAK